MANDQKTIAILAKRSFIFFNPNSPGEERVVVSAGPDIVSVPDWVADTKHFELAENDGGIVVVGNDSRGKSKKSKADEPDLGLESDKSSKKNS